MAVVRRDIFGPDAASERAAADVYQPTKTSFQSFREFMMGGGSAVILAAAAVTVAVEPAVVAGAMPFAFLYAWAVLRRPVKLPLRLPASARRLDYNHPLPGTRKPRQAEGIIFLGVDQLSGEELWISNDDGRQHGSFGGVTGSGKTKALLGLCANHLSFGSGFVFVDAKGDTGLFADVYRIARIFNREKDVRTLNFRVASGAKDSQSFNPFAWAGADAIREMLVSQVESSAGHGGDNKVFMQKAVALLGAWAPILIWMRDHRQVPIDIDAIRFATELPTIAELAFERRYRRRDPETGRVSHMDASDMPEILIAPLRSYLGDTGGYDMDVHQQKRPKDKAAEQHSYVTMHFSSTFTQLAVSLGHIFRCQISGIDMRDVAINRRILAVVLPALENSGETTLALGRLVVAAIRNMQAQTLGGPLEGKHGDVVANRPTSASTPSAIIYDEVASIVNMGMTEQLQQARGLGQMMVLGWHDIAGLKVKIGDGAYSLLNNANLQVIMRQNEGGMNRTHFEQTVGDAEVTQNSTYRAQGVGFVPSDSVQVQRRSRLDWRTARGQIEGEATIVLANHRIYAKLFYPDTGRPNDNDAYRLNRPIEFHLPPPDGPRRQAERVAKVREALERGGSDAPARPLPPILRAVLDGFTSTIAAGHSLASAADAAIFAAGAVPTEPQQPAPAPASGAPETEFTPALARAAARQAAETGGPASLAPITRQVEEMLAALAAVEQAAGLPEDAAREEAMRTVAARDEALGTARLPQPPDMAPGQLRDVLLSLLEDLAGEE